MTITHHKLYQIKTAPIDCYATTDKLVYYYFFYCKPSRVIIEPENETQLLQTFRQKQFTEKYHIYGTPATLLIHAKWKNHKVSIIPNKYRSRVHVIEG